MKWKLAAAGALGIAIVAGGAIVTAVNDDEATGGTVPELDVNQAVSAEDSGVRLVAKRAAFSGTGTFVELEATAGEESAFSSPAVRMELSPGDFVQDSLKLPAGAMPASLAIGHATPIRFEAASSQNPPALELQSLPLFRADGSSQSVTGRWRLELSTPDDLESRLETEHLSGEAAADGSARVAIEGAVRSITETLVTVRYDFTEPIDTLFQPALFANGERWFGSELTRNGSLVTYSFPATEFGPEVEVRFGPFVRTTDATIGTARVDLGAVVRTHDLTGSYPESAAILAGDAVSHEGALQAPTELRFGSYGQPGQPGGNRTAEVSFPGVLAPAGSKPEELFSVVDSAGRPLRVATFYVSLGQNSAGVQGTNPRTSVAFLVESLDTLESPVTITYAGNPTELIRGEWLVRLRPV